MVRQGCGEEETKESIAGKLWYMFELRSISVFVYCDKGCIGWECEVRGWELVFACRVLGVVGRFAISALHQRNNTGHLYLPINILVLGGSQCSDAS